MLIGQRLEYTGAGLPQLVTIRVPVHNLEAMADKKSVVVVGGGWCGLYALKWFLQEGLDAVLYEKTESLGKHDPT